MKMERMDGCKIIRFPRPIDLQDGLPKFTTHQVYMMRALLENNNVDLSQFETTPATDDEKRSVELSLAKAYNSTIAEQQRKIINSYKRTPRFTFSCLERDCFRDCKLRGWGFDRLTHETFSGCTAHDVVNVPFDEEGNFGFFECLSQVRDVLDNGYQSLTPEGHFGRAKQAAGIVLESMDVEIFQCLAGFELDEDDHGYIGNPDITPSELLEEKFKAMDVMYKVFHCLLTEDNPLKREIRSRSELWRPLEAVFVKVFNLFDADDLYHFATDNDGIWCDMFDFVCEFAEKEGILPQLNEARKVIAEVYFDKQQHLAKWLKRLKGN